uniref:Laminin G domain-containing protein n=1 Tax=Caenorhabditis japonica TaxID=281687 RepID=A0A8R1DEY6_CAEJA
MRLLQFSLSIWLIVRAASSTSVFQGSCAAEHVLCEQLCESLSPDTYQCSCWEGHELQDDGLSCKLKTDVQYSEERKSSTLRGARVFEPSTELPLKRMVVETVKGKKLDASKPLAFKGNNYAEFPVKDDSYLETNITIQFKLDEHNDGIIFFAGELMGDDFLSVTLDGPNIILRQVYMYHGKFGIGEWHEINVWRKYCDLTEMKVDSGRMLVDHADEFKNYKGITMDEGVFLGAAPHNIEYLQQKTGISEGFRGCVRLLIVNGEVLLNSNETVNKAFDTSINYYCGQDENEKELEDSDDVIKIEMFDLTQRGIPKILETPGMNLPSPTLKPIASSLPPLGHPILKEIVQELPSTTTTTTKKPLPANWKVAHFTGTSKVVLTAPESILNYLELSIQFKTEKSSGVIFFWKEDTKFLVVTLENSFVKVYASVGVDTTILRSENAVSLYHWHKLEVWRSGKGVLLKVNKQSWVESELHGIKDDILEETGDIYIGAVNPEDTPTVVKQTEGFAGCVKRIRLNGRSIQMQSNLATNVSECFTDPCSSSGCPKQCISHNSQPICQCEWPLTGHKCSLTAESDLSSMAFAGFSHLELDDEAVMSHITGDSLNLAVNFKIRNVAENVRQIIVSAGDVTHEDDFFELSLDTNRFIRFSLNLGSGIIVLTHPTRIEEERWITVEVIRKKNEVKLSVNGEDPITAFAPEGAEQLNVYKSVFVGNNYLPEGSSDGRDFTGFHGCIISLRFDQTTISHPKQAKTAINIQDCQI